MSRAWADAVEGEGEAPVVVPKPAAPEAREDSYFRVRQLEDEVARLHLVVRAQEIGLERLQRSFDAMRGLVEEVHASRDVLFRELGGETMMTKLRDERAARASGVSRALGAAEPEAENEPPWQQASRRRGGGRKDRRGGGA